MVTKKTVYYCISIPVHSIGHLEAEFPAKDVKHHDKRKRNAICLSEAKMIAGEQGFVLKKTTTLEIAE